MDFFNFSCVKKNSSDCHTAIDINGATFDLTKSLHSICETETFVYWENISWKANAVNK